MRNPAELEALQAGSFGHQLALNAFLQDVFQQLTGIQPGLVPLKQYAVADLPAIATDDPNKYIAYCTDEAGGAIPVFYDGTNWRRVSDRAIAS